MVMVLHVVLIFLIGSFVPVQTAMNTTLARIVHNPLMASFLVFLASTLFLFCALIATRAEWPTREMLGQVPPYIWLSGVMGASYIFILVRLTPQVGIGLGTCAVVFGQVVMSLIIDHYGWLHMPHLALSAQRVMAAGLIALGVVMLQFF